MKFFSRLFSRSPSHQPSPQKDEGVRSEPSHDCAIWHEVNRALDMSPRSAGEKIKVRGFEPSQSVGEGATS